MLRAVRGRATCRFAPSSSSVVDQLDEAVERREPGLRLDTIEAVRMLHIPGRL
jgi:hypothetical protein